MKLYIYEEIDFKIKEFINITGLGKRPATSIWKLLNIKIIWKSFWFDLVGFYDISYLPTPLLGQDMTQGQFLSGV